MGVHWAEKEGFWGGAWWGLLEVEVLIRARAHSRHRIGTSPELGNDHMLSLHPAELQLSLPFSPWPQREGPAVAQVSGVCSFPVGCLGEAQVLSS